MSVERAIRDMVADEVARALAPIHAQLAQLNGNSAVIARLAAALGTPIKRGPGRPPKALTAVSTASAGGARRGRRSENAGRACAVIGCGRDARSKGYCAAHYQKFRMLDRTGRLPPGWVADAPPNSVENIKLPRGRAGAAAIAATKKK
ncbi:MAG: cell wall protein [Archangium sp.]